ncbi:MAG: hypothetical protein ABJ387_01330 [Balneola sp.]
MRKFTEKLAISILVFAIIIPTYIYYCDFFWGSYFEYETNLPENSLYAFEAVDNESNLQITHDNFKDFTWKREMVTVDHANWHLHYISFPSDSLITIYSKTEYLESYYYSFPVIKTLLFDKEKPSQSYTEIFDSQTMEIIKIAEDNDFIYSEGEEISRIKVILIDQKLIVYWAWL